MVGDEYSRSPVRPLGRSILFCLQINCEQYLLHGSGSGYWCIIYLLHVLYRSYSTMMCKKSGRCHDYENDNKIIRFCIWICADGEAFICIYSTILIAFHFQHRKQWLTRLPRLQIETDLSSDWKKINGACPTSFVLCPCKGVVSLRLNQQSKGHKMDSRPFCSISYKVANKDQFVKKFRLAAPSK